MFALGIFGIASRKLLK
ncbi:hypothetical protein [Colwellia sp. BRX8-4]